MFKLNFNYTDIKKLRALVGVSAASLAEKIPVCKSHMSDLENGKKGLSIEMYKRILECLEIEYTLLASTENILSNRNNEVYGMSKIYNVKAKVVENLEKIIKSKQKEVEITVNNCDTIDDLFDLNQLLRIYKSGDDRLFIANNEYAIISKDGLEHSYELCSKVLHLDREAFENRVLDENYIEILNEDWSIPTLEGYSVDLYCLISDVMYIKELPVLEYMFYRTLKEKEYRTEDGIKIIPAGSIGRIEDIENIKEDKISIYFGRDEDYNSKEAVYRYDEIEVAKQLISHTGSTILEEGSQILRTGIYK